MLSHPVSLVACIGVGSSPHLISHFVRHYQTLGIERFLVVLHAPREDPRLPEARARLGHFGIRPVREIDEYSAALKLRHCTEVTQEHCAPEAWVVHADVDEFQLYPGNLASYLHERERAGRGFVRGRLIDRLAPGGALVDIQPEPPLWEQFPMTFPVTRKLLGGWDRKVCATLARVALADGGSHALRLGWGTLWDYRLTHYRPRLPERRVEIHHFKWDATLPRRVRNKIEGREGDLDRWHGRNFMNEYEILNEHLQCNGRIAMEALGAPRRSSL